MTQEAEFGTLWVNPFLNDFYKWDEGTWWPNKSDFIDCLDNPKSIFTAKSYSDEEKKDWNYYNYLPREIASYIIENVPEWYYQGCIIEGVPKMRTTINAFSAGAGGYGRRRFLNAWKNDEPFITGVEFLPIAKIIATMGTWPDDKEMRVKGYKYYPPNLKWKGNALKSHRHYGGYVRLIDVAGIHYNSIYFTAQKNKSWCKTSKISYLNWTLRNPTEVKE